MADIHRMPPIQYLPTFVVAARHASFKMAAGELNVTPSAISQQISNLEGCMGFALFSREKRALRLTKAGEDFYQVTRKLLSSYESDYAQFMSEHFSSTLKISMIPYVANEVVIPQLHGFQQQYPDLNLVVQTSMQIENLGSTEVDAAIRFGVPPWEGYDVELICNVSSGLLATSSYFKKYPINTRKDWQQQTLIHIRSSMNDWERFMDSIGFHFKPQKELYFDSYDAGIRAAEEGLGIVIGVFPISNKKVSQGNLVGLSQKQVPIEEGFYLVTKSNTRKQGSYQILLNWLKVVFGDL